MFSRRHGLRSNRGRVAAGTPAVGGGGDTDPPGMTWAVAADGASIVGTASEDCDETSTPAGGDFGINGASVTVDTPAWLSATSLSLPLVGVILSSDTVTIDYTAGVNPIRDLALNEADDIVAGAVTNNSTIVPTLRMITWWASTTWTPDTTGDTMGECWGGGGGSTTNTSGGGGGAYARDDVFTRTSGVGITITVGAGGTAGGGTGGTTSIGSTCIAVGAAGNTGGAAGSCTGDVTRSGGDGVVSATGSGGASPGSTTDASGTTPGETDGGRGGTGGGNSSARIPGGGARAGASFQGPGEQGLARATYYEPSDGATPPIDGMSHQRTGSGTTHPVAIPSGSGTTIVYVIMADGAPTIGLDSGTPTTVLTATNGTACTLQVMTHAASGAPTNVTTSATEATQIWVFRVSDLTAISGTGANATGTNADPPSHDMGSSAPTLWMTGLCFNSEPNDMITGGPPSGYEDSHYGSSVVNSGGVEGMVAWRRATGQTENPGTFTNESREHCSFTLGMR